MSREIYSELMKALVEGSFVFTGEIEPVKTTNLHEVLETAKILKGNVVAANVTDNPTAFGYLNALIPSWAIQEKVGLEAVYQMTCRDRNRLALLSDFLAAGALGIKNVLALTGDHVSAGDDPRAKPVFDLDSATMVQMLKKMTDEGMDLAGNKIIDPPRFHIGIAANPGADPLEPEILKIKRKVKLGAEFIQTQAIYDVEVAKRFVMEAEYLKIPILVGIAPLKSLAMLDWMVKFVPGIAIPENIQERLRKAREEGGKEGLYQENIRIFGNMVQEIKETTSAAGIHVMAIGFEWIVPKILGASGLRVENGVSSQHF